MGKKDIQAHEFLANNARFADLCNYFLFDGREIIAPDELKEQDTTEIFSAFGISKKELHLQKWRDLLKHVVVKSTNHCTYIIIGVENQSEIHYAMPIKNMIYDAINYGRQTKEAAKMHKKKKDTKNNAEFLTGFTKEDKLTPVITLTVYWGCEEWDAPRSLHEMLRISDESVLQYVSDYKLNLIAPCEISDFSKFNTSLGPVLQLLRVANDEVAMGNLITTNLAFRELENEAVETINVFAGLNIQPDEEKEVTDMCKAWDDHYRSGVQNGIQKGIQQGLQKGLQRGEHAKRIEAIENMILLGLTKEKILTKYSEEEYEEAEKAMLVET